MSKTRHYGALVRTFGVTFLSPYTVRYPVAGWDQLIYATEGVLTVQTSEGVWVLPAHRALWVPDGVPHEIRIPGPASLRSIYLRARMARHLPRQCRAVNVPPLLRELILHCVGQGALLSRKPVHRRLAAVLMDQLQTLPSIPMQLPDPVDPRARKLSALLHNAPSNSLSAAAAACGISLRTAERIYRAETGMSLGNWTRRLRLLVALQQLASGHTVNEAAAAAGYRGPSAFVSMFRREMGLTPGRYFASHAHR
ncbi:MAG: helix-turn-helix transcriptional regulator [Bryobacterales bacterium]|nr:helix-turn-helix transcriptional regulator [Bryobacterales bacterium]